MAKSVLIRNSKPGFPLEFDAGSSGASKTISFLNGTPQKLTLTADCTVTIADLSSGGVIVLRVLQDSTPRTLTITDADYGEIGAPSLSALTTGQYILLNIFKDGDSNLTVTYSNGHG